MDAHVLHELLICVSVYDSKVGSTSGTNEETNGKATSCAFSTLICHPATNRLSTRSDCVLSKLTSGVEIICLKSTYNDNYLFSF